jgi:hypothetical protein
MKVCQDKIPNVPYATVLDTFLIANHVMILAVGATVLTFSYFYQYPKRYSCFMCCYPCAALYDSTTVQIAFVVVVVVVVLQKKISKLLNKNTHVYEHTHTHIYI